MHFYLRKKIEKDPQLELSYYFRLGKLFNDKGWEIENDNEKGLYKRCYRTLSNLNSDEKNLFLDLTNSFLLIDNYKKEIKPSILKLINDFPNVKKYYVLPIITPEDINDISKSSYSVSYIFKGHSIKYIDTKGVSFNVLKKYEDIKNFKLSSTQKILLVDDFIGTGETALSAINYLKTYLPIIKPEQVKVLCIVAQEKGIMSLNNLDFYTCCSHKVNRGISDNFEGVELSNAIKIMEGIENRIQKLKNDFKFGYKRSEALVCMNRCPNNTFPIYWLPKNDAPYER